MDSWPEITKDRVFTLEEIDKLSTSEIIYNKCVDLEYESLEIL
jgi:hypothetical protein